MPVLDTPDGPISWDRAGRSGPPVLLVQGTGLTAGAWGPQIAALADRCRLVWLDNRGIGGSAAHRGPSAVPAMADDARRVLDAAGLDRAVIVGHSLGGLIALELARSAPDRAAGLVLAASPADGWSMAIPAAASWWLACRTQIGTRASRRAAWLEFLFPREEIARIGAAPLAARLEAAFGRAVEDLPAVATRQILGARSYRPGDLGAVRTPTLVVLPEGDRVVHPSSSERLAAGIPGARLVRYPGAGHAFPFQPELGFDDLLHAFAAEVSG